MGLFAPVWFAEVQATKTLLGLAREEFQNHCVSMRSKTQIATMLPDNKWIKRLLQDRMS